jgi:hypothetical protein
MIKKMNSFDCSVGLSMTFEHQMSSFEHIRLIIFVIACVLLNLEMTLFSVSLSLIL